jgi:hypothetical protein
MDGEGYAGSPKNRGAGQEIKRIRQVSDKLVTAGTLLIDGDHFDLHKFEARKDWFSDRWRFADFANEDRFLMLLWSVRQTVADVHLFMREPRPVANKGTLESQYRKACRQVY